MGRHGHCSDTRRAQNVNQAGGSAGATLCCLRRKSPNGDSMGGDPTAMVESTWEVLERPVLEAIAKRESEGRRSGPSTYEILEDTGLPSARVQNALRRLRLSGYLQAVDVTTQESTGPEYIMIELLEPGLRAVGVWPGDPYDAVLAIVMHQLDIEPDADRKGRLERFRNGLVGVGREVVTGVLTAYATSAIPK